MLELRPSSDDLRPTLSVRTGHDDPAQQTVLEVFGFLLPWCFYGHDVKDTMARLWA